MGRRYVVVVQLQLQLLVGAGDLELEVELGRALQLLVVLENGFVWVGEVDGDGLPFGA